MSDQLISVFFSYSHEDEGLRDELAKHLRIFERQGIIQSWHDRKILPGQEWDTEISENLETADIILLLISSDFLDSDYCWNIEVKRAIERHEAKEAVVIPIILRSCLWNSAPFGKLQALPKNDTPVVSSSWHTKDEAFSAVASELSKTIEALQVEKANFGGDYFPPLPMPTQKRFAGQIIGNNPNLFNLIQLNRGQQIKDGLSRENGNDYIHLRDLLKAQDWKAADQETYKVISIITKKEIDNYLSPQDFEKFSCSDLLTIDSLWMNYSQQKFGFTTQKNIFSSFSKGLMPLNNNAEFIKEIYRQFAINVGWRMDKCVDYSDIIFNGKIAPKGHFPTILGSEWFSVNVYNYPSLFLRLMTCSEKSEFSSFKTPLWFS